MRRPELYTSFERPLLLLKAIIDTLLPPIHPEGGLHGKLAGRRKVLVGFGVRVMG